MTELGSKHECISCGAKFYDLGKSEVICPKCGADQQQLAEAESKEKAPRSKKTPRSRKRRPVAEKEAERAGPEGKKPEDDEVLADAEDLDEEEPEDEDEE